jgi:8-oxo-dGTP pyrophosphatase MutT (NUDIX family)
MPPEAIARPAATILLLRDGPQGLEVFMVVRHHQIDFASGALVFPGGRVEDADHALAATLEPRLAIDPPTLPFRIAAIRETFEECGVLLARRLGAAEVIGADVLQRLDTKFRAALDGGTIGLDAVLQAEDLEPATDLLVHFAHWITPANQPKRYDTQFFLAQAPAAHLAVHDGHEAVESIWIRPAEALAETEAGRFKLVFATAKNLEKLARSASVTEAMDRARASRVVTVQPKPIRFEGSRRVLQIPADADYGGSEFTVDLPPASS